MDSEVILPRIGENPLLALIIFGFIGYLCGSLPFSIWVTRIVKGIDVRDAGSKHATTTNTIRQAGFGPGIVVLIFDIAKGYLPTYLAFLSGVPAWIVGLVAAAAVAGHCWPVFAKFRGGMGLATGGGAVLSISALGFIILLGVLIALALLIKHSARASLIAGLLAAPVLYLFPISTTGVWVALGIGLVVAVRFTVDWNREYRELWLDREID